MNNETFDTETVGIVKTVKNKKVIELLKNQGKNVIEFPEIKTEKTELKDNDNELFQNIEAFDWLVFKDIFSVDYFLENLNEIEFDLYRLDEFNICANGEAVADRLRFSQIHSDVIPRDKSPQTILSSISDYVFDETEFGNSKFLIIKNENSDDAISKLFVESKLETKTIDVYKIVDANPFEIAKYKILFSDDEIDRFIFTSPEDFQSLKQILDGFEFTQNKIEFETTDEITAQTLIEFTNKKEAEK